MVEDEYFAADLDADRRKIQTSQEIIAENEAKQIELQKLVESKSRLLGADISDLGLATEFNPDFDIQAELDRQALLMASAENKQAEERRLQALAEAARLPLKFVRLVEAKRRVRENAWKKWEPIAIKKAKLLSGTKGNSPAFLEQKHTDNNSECSSSNSKCDFTPELAISRRGGNVTSLSWPHTFTEGLVSKGPIAGSTGWIEITSQHPDNPNGVNVTYNNNEDSSTLSFNPNAVPMTVTWKIGKQFSKFKGIREGIILLSSE
jgi:hypothetical protein